MEDNPTYLLIQLVALVVSYLIYRLLKLNQKTVLIDDGKNFKLKDFIVISTAIIFLNMGISFLVIYIFSLYDLAFLAETFSETSDSAIVSHPVLENIIFYLQIIILAPLWEELMFRGVVCKGVGLRSGVISGIVLSSVLFSLFHLDFLGKFVAGFVLAIVYVRTNSITKVILLHAIVNFSAISLELFFNFPDTSSLESIVAFCKALLVPGIILTVISLPVIVFMLYKFWPRKLVQV